MIDINNEPYKKIVVRSFMRFESPKTFAEDVYSDSPRGNPVPKLFWANGIVFRHFPYFASEAISQELIKGILHVDHVEYAEMKEYHKEINIASNQRVRIINVTNHSVFSFLTKYITDNLPMKPTEEKEQKE